MKLLHVVALLALGLFFIPLDAQAGCTTQTVNSYGNGIAYTGSCTEDDEVLITTGDVSRYSECTVISTTGAVEILVSNDFAVAADLAVYTTTTVSLVDLGATDTAPVKLTAALRYYAFPLVAVRFIKVVENGTTDAAASLTCK
jgi:hypothetical protein